MRKTKDVLRFHYEGQLSRARIGKALGRSKGVASKHLSLLPDNLRSAVSKACR